MRTQKLGYTELNFSKIGFGTWALGGEGWKFSWGPQDDKVSIKTIYHALDKGINWIDTAAVYGLGHAEEVVGAALEGLSPKPYIATKCSRRWTEKKEIYSALKRNSIIEEAENSLRRLRIEVIDLFQLHWPRPEEDIEEAWDTIATLVKQGKVRYGGVSNFNIHQMERIKNILPIASLQPPYSMLSREIENGVINYCSKNKIGIICYSPLYKGLLTGKMTRERIQNLPSSDHRCNDPRFHDPELSIDLDLVHKLQKIASEKGITVSQLSLAWILRHSEITSAIAGGRSPEQIEETAQAADIFLNPQDVEKIEKLLITRDKLLEKES